MNKEKVDWDKRIGLPDGISLEETYEVRVYKTQEDVDNFNFEIIDEGILNREEAMKIGEQCFKTKEFKMVKVQNSDRNFIHMFFDNRNL